jgi:tetratricopeptide (TPR) repeat protein
MTASEDQARALFLAALERATDLWPAFLDEACGNSPELRSRVEQLLQAHQAMGSIHGGDGQSPATVVEPSRETPGTMIGPFKLLEQIGEGGMGTVWMAQQTEPVKRLVALKMIKLGMDSQQVITRFEVERQALALMDHPNIAKVHDAGRAPDGRPYFVMELVKGVPLTKYCDEHRLTPRQRLELFIPVCQAVQHAHQKGIIHRDIKPSNVLVALYDGKPVPKVIDFGIAKATGAQLTEHTLVTGFGAVVGTLEYMSPEQAELNQLDVDTRSDIYSLGVLLYELLTGTTPLERKRLKETAILEVLRLIREEEPPRPSTRLSESKDTLPSISAQRQTEPAKLTKLVRGELDWIVMKALEKDRNRRYESANGFAQDVQRYLADEPVAACPPSAWYRLRKMVRRNRGVLTTVGVIAVAVVLAVAAVAASVGWVTRDRAARRAEAKTTLDEATRLIEQGQWPEAKALAGRAEALLTGGADVPDLQERLQHLLDDLKLVVRIEEARIRQTDIVKDDQVDPAFTDAEYVKIFQENGIDVDNLDPTETAAHLRTRAIRVELAAALDDWAVLRSGMRKKDDVSWKALLATARLVDPDPWRDRFRDVLEKGDRQSLVEIAGSAELSRLSAASLHRLATVLRFWGDLDKAVAVLAKARMRYPGDFWINEDMAVDLVLLHGLDRPAALPYFAIAVAIRPESPGAQLNFGIALRSNGLLDQAVDAFRVAVRLKPDFLAHKQLGWTLRATGRVDEAIAAFEEAIRCKPGAPEAHTYLGLALVDKGSLGRAEAAYNKAIELAPTYALAWNARGVLYHNHLRQRDKAVADFKEACRLQPSDEQAHENLARALLLQGKIDEAIAAYQKTIALVPADPVAQMKLGLALAQKDRFDDAIAAYRLAIRLKSDDPLVHYYLGVVLEKKGKPDEAIAEYRASLRLRPNSAQTHCALANTLRDKGAWKQAAIEYEEALRLKPGSAMTHFQLGVAYHRQGQWLLAMAAYQQAVRLEPGYVEAHLNLGMILETINRTSEAIASYEEALRLMEKLPPEDPTKASALGSLAWAYISVNKIQEGQRLLDQLPARGVTETIPSMVTLAIQHREAGRLPEALALLEEARRRIGKPPGPIVAGMNFVAQELGKTYDEAGQLVKAEAMYRECLEPLRQQVGRSPSMTLAGLLSDLAQNLLDQGKYAEAESVARESMAIRAQVESNLWTFYKTKCQVAAALLGQKKYAEAEPLLLEGYAGMKQHEANIRPAWRYDRLSRPLRSLVQLYEALDNKDEAARWRKELEAFLKSNPAPRRQTK